MFEDINDRLEQIKERMKKKRKWEMQLSDYRMELEEVEKSIYGLEDQLTDEMKDVERLKKIGLVSLFQALLGSKEEKMKKEEQDVVAVQLQLKEANNTKMEICHDIDEIENKLNEVEHIESAYRDLLTEKEKMITESKTFYARQLFEVSERKGDIQAYIKELEEAIHAGEAAKNALANAVNSLEGAERWGVFDLFGGGALVGLLKHDRIDKAAEYIHVAQSRMRSFQKELLDIEEISNLQIDIPNLLKFADFFFDGIIADLAVQGRIQDVLKEAKIQESNVKRIITGLKFQLGRKKKALDKMKKKREKLIAGF